MSSIDEPKQFIPLNIAVLTVSDTRTLEDDKSGTTLSERLTAAGHNLAAREIVADEVDAIRILIKKWIADRDIDAIITTGGTGFTGRDVTPEAIEPLFEKRMDGHLDSSEPRHRGRRGRHLYLLPAGIAGRLPRRVGRHPRGPARLPDAALQLRRDHAEARRAPAPPEGEGRIGLTVIPGRANPESRDFSIKIPGSRLRVAPE